MRSQTRSRGHVAAAASALLLSGLLLAESTSAATYTLHHRIHPGAWSQRGVIRTGSDASGSDVAQHAFVPSDETGTYTDTTGRSDPWRGLSNYENASEDFYQLAVTPDERSKVDEVAPITLARVCQLATDGPESITLHLADASDEVIGLTYDLPGLDAAQLDTKGCPQNAKGSASRSGVEIYLSKPEAPLSLLPPPPPPTKADGTPLAEGEEPPKEKSFVAKYWMYILPVVLLMVIPTEIADSNNEEAENGGGDGSLFQGGVQKGTKIASKQR